MMQEFKKSRWGYPVQTTSEECINCINEFFHQVLIYGPRRKIIFQASEADPQCVLANTLSAWCIMSVHAKDAALILSKAKQNAGNATDYEVAVLEAVTPLVDGNTIEAHAAHSKLLQSFPADLVSLKRVQVLCFSMGNPDEMLRYASMVLPANMQSAYMYGMMAFPLIELGRTDEAETAAKKALAIEGNDVWAQHAVCHVLQERKAFKQAISFMEENSKSWHICGSFLYSHQWWHLANCHLEDNSLKAALNIFDNHIWGERERGEMDIAQVSLNALGLLLSIQLKGYGDEIGERVLQVATYLLDESKWYKEWLLDLLIVWALAKCSNLAESQRLVSNLSTRVHMLGGNKEVQLSLVALSSALYEYGAGNEKAVFELLGPSFNALDLKVIGASNEQMQVFTHLWSSTRGQNN